MIIILKIIFNMIIEDLILIMIVLIMTVLNIIIEDMVLIMMILGVYIDLGNNENLNMAFYQNSFSCIDCFFVYSESSF